MRNEYTVSGEGEEPIISFGKLVEDSIDDVPSYEFECNKLFSTNINIDSVKPDDSSFETAIMNDANQKDNVDFAVNTSSTNMLNLKETSGDNANETFIVNKENITNEVRLILEAITITISDWLDEVAENVEKHPLLPGCDCKAKNCNLNIDEENRKKINEQFWRITRM